MAASLHLASYSFRDTGRMLRAMRRHRANLEATPGLAAMNLFFTARFDSFTGGTPTPTKWGLLCGWETPEARDQFLGEPGRLAPFVRDAREAWSVSLDTVRVVQGEWRGWQPSSDGIEPLTRDEPVAVITYGQVRPRYLPAFHWNNRKVVREMNANPGNVLGLGLADGPVTRATFSIWRSKGDVVRFAYGAGGVHDPIQRRSLETGWGGDYFFGRFRPVASSGTWDGSDPLGRRLPSDREAWRPLLGWRPGLVSSTPLRCAARLRCRG